MASPTLTASIQVFLDGPAHQGVPLGIALANLPRGDLQAPNQNHGFAFRLTDPRLYDDHDHSVQVYLVGSTLVQLGSPLVFHCGMNNASFVTLNAPSNMVMGTSYPVTITFQNTGTRTWLQYPKDGYHRLGTQTPQDNLRWGASREELPRDVPPGSTVTLNFSVTPQAVGQATFQWQLVDELVQWFGDKTPPLSVDVKAAVNVGKTAVNVKDYGAVGDGVTDDSNAIQAAINDTAPGGTLTIPEGKYIIGTSHGQQGQFAPNSCGVDPNAQQQTGLLVNRPYLTIAGAGRGTILQLAGNVKMRIITIVAPNTTIEKLVLDGNAANRNRMDPATGQPYNWPCALVVDALLGGNAAPTGNVTIRDVEARNGIEDGLGLSATPNFTTQNVYVHNVGGYGLNPLYQEAAGGLSIALSGGAHPTARNNVVIGNTYGIAVGGGSIGADISYNVSVGNCSAGLILGSGPGPIPPPQPDSNFTVRQNWVERNGADCGDDPVSVLGGQIGTISNNYIVNNAFSGISFDDEGAGWPASLNWQVHNNLIANNQENAVRLKGRSGGIDLEGNQIENNGSSFANQVSVDPSATGGVNADWTTTNSVTYSPPPANQPVPAIGGIVNAASEQPGAIAPGEILSIFGLNLGPAKLIAAAPNSDGRLERILSGTRVLFDGVPGAMLYTSAGQIAVMAPYYLYWKNSTSVQVEYNSVKSDPVTVVVQQSQPAIFTLDASGHGPGAILNQDYSLNSPTNPASRGSIVMLYATGEGQTDSAGIDGLLANAALPTSRLPVSVTIGGVKAPVLYAGAAPTFVAGTLQVNVAVPSTAPVGNAVPIQITIGNVTSPGGVIMALK